VTWRFEPPSVRRYDGIAVGMDGVHRELRIRCALIAMQIFEEQLGQDHPLYIEFQARAIGLASN